MKIYDVLINGIREPIGYDFGQIHLSWKVLDSISARAEAVEISVSTDPDQKNLIYQSTMQPVADNACSLHLELQSRTRYYVHVRVQGEDGDSAEARTFFETGKMGESWRGAWIAAPAGDDRHPIFFKDFAFAEEVQNARLYISGAGVFEAYLNGRQISEERLTPYINDYEDGLQIFCWPLDADCFTAENRLEFMVGKGWYMSTFGLSLKDKNFGSRMAAIAELHVVFADGSTRCIATGADWLYKGSYVDDSGIYLGEIQDRLRYATEQEAGKAVEVLVRPELAEETRVLATEKLRDRLSLPVLPQERFKTPRVIHTPAGEIVLDFGQNFAGVLEFYSELPKGAEVVFDFGEILQGGNFYNQNYRDAESQFRYVSDGEARWVRPHFTFFGFRFARVTGWAGELLPEDFAGVALYSDLAQTGSIQTGHAKLNRLFLNSVWGAKSNFLDMPTDCPQRSERLAWTGDAQAFAPTASYHMDTRAFFHKFLVDLRSEQVRLDGAIPHYIPNLDHMREASNVWADIACFLPETLYQFFGDLDRAAEYYPLMRDWVDYLDRKDAERGEKRYIIDFTFQFGDWLALDGVTETSFKGSTDDSYIGSVYYYRSTEILAQMAERLGKDADARYFRTLQDKIREAVLKEFFSPTGRLAIDTQSAYIIALKFGLYIDKDKLIEGFKARLQKDLYKIKCGFVGAPLLCTVLGEIGEIELAYDFLLREDFPSWLYGVNLGATTIWERWNSVLPDGTISDTGMNSLNHYAYGSVLEYVYAYAAGIRPLEPGFRRAVLAPEPDYRLGHLEARYESRFGSYVSQWSIEEDGQLRVHVEVPFGCGAELRLPRYDGDVQILSAGSYDYHYVPTSDYRLPFSAETRLLSLADSPEALAILEKYVPVLAHMSRAKGELSVHSLTSIAHLHFLPFDPVALAEATKEIVKLQVKVGGRP